jgi:hypothetical protein
LATFGGTSAVAHTAGAGGFVVVVGVLLPDPLGVFELLEPGCFVSV